MGKGLRVLLVLATLITAVALATAQDVAREDGLALENLALKITLHETRVQGLQRDIQQAAQALQRERGILEKVIQDKYGVSLDRIERQGDVWVVKPAAPSTPPPTGAK